MIEQTPQIANSIVIPVTMAFSISFALLSSIIGSLLWAFSTFEKKTDASIKHSTTEIRLGNHEKLLGEVARDVSYIRGLLDKNES